MPKLASRAAVSPNSNCWTSFGICYSTSRLRSIPRRNPGPVAWVHPEQLALHCVPAAARLFGGLAVGTLPTLDHEKSASEWDPSWDDGPAHLNPGSEISA